MRIRLGTWCLECRIIRKDDRAFVEGWPKMSDSGSQNPERTDNSDSEHLQGLGIASGPIRNERRGDKTAMLAVNEVYGPFDGGLREEAIAVARNMALAEPEPGITVSDATLEAVRHAFSLPRPAYGRLARIWHLDLPRMPRLGFRRASPQHPTQVLEIVFRRCLAVS